MTRPCRRWTDEHPDRHQLDALANHPCLTELGEPLYVLGVSSQGAFAWPLPLLRGADVPGQLEAIDAIVRVLRTCAEDLEARAGMVRDIEKLGGQL